MNLKIKLIIIFKPELKIGFRMKNDHFSKLVDQHSENWKNRETLAEAMIPIIGRLYRENNIILTIYGRSLVNCSVIEILKLHRRVRMVDPYLSVTDTFPLLDSIKDLNIHSCKIDLGRLTNRFKKDNVNLKSFLDANITNKLFNQPVDTSTDVVLYGFGRIGRILARLLLEKNTNKEGLTLKAIVVRKRSDDDLHKRASLLRRDSIHGQFKGTISVDEDNEAIIVNGNYIKIIYENNEEPVIDFSKFGISYATLIDNTGKNRDTENLEKHLKCNGISKVIVTAPTGSSIKNIVYGVNHNQIARSDKIISAASCTTNAIAPILHIIHNKFGIESGHIETVHSYTNDQNLLDNYHKKDRRGRSAVINMVITETGAAEAIKSILPELNGKITGSAIRVPTADVSIAILNLRLSSLSSKEEINEYVRQISNSELLQEQIDYTNSTEVVSSDFIGSQTAGIFDAQATIVNGNQITLYVWYDNEMGYSSQVLRIASKIAGIQYLNIQ